MSPLPNDSMQRTALRAAADAERQSDMSMGAVARWWWRVRRGLRRIRGPYARWSVSRWETPVSDVDRLLLVSLCDRDERLRVTVEASWEPSRPRCGTTSLPLSTT